MTRDHFIFSLLRKPMKKSPLKLASGMTRRLSESSKVVFSYVAKRLSNIPIRYQNVPFFSGSLSGPLVLSMSTVTSLDKVIIISHVDDANSLLIGLFCLPPNILPQLFPQYGQMDPSKSQVSSSHYPASKNL